jgi:hypothetical protein
MDRIIGSSVVTITSRRRSEGSLKMRSRFQQMSGRPPTG